jgi:ribosomal protein S18 acetylase RimI-like enzyme
MRHLLDNIVWHCLTGLHAQHATGTATIKRFAPGFSPIIGFADLDCPDFTAIAPFCAAGEHFYTVAWPGPAQPGWTIEQDAPGLRMVYAGPAPDDDATLAAVRLDATHVPAMQALVALTQPGPFAARTIELGEYFGVFAGERLVAMAGERMGVDRYREISGVCTHPEVQGRGLARRLVAKLMTRQIRRGLTPFLHVMEGNTNARRLYERMGFALDARMMLRVVARTA